MKNTLDYQTDLIMPQVIGLVVTGREKVNICPVNWQVVSTKYESPMTACIGMSHSSYSLETILQNKEFVFAYPNQNQLKDSLYCGTVSGRDVDKLLSTNFQFDQSKTINSPCIRHAVLNFECKLHSTVPMGNYTIVVGLITCVHESSRGMLDKIYSLGGQTYGVIEKTTTLQTGRG